MRPQVLKGRGKGAVVLVYETKVPELATFTDPFNYTIDQLSFTMHAAITKIPDLLYEKNPT